MAIEKVGIYRKWLEPVPKRNGNPIPKSEWPKKRRYCWIVRWCGTNLKKYGKLFKTRKEAEKYALDLQKQVNLGKGDKPQQVTLQQFRLEHEQIMKGQVAYGTIQEHMRALKFFENYIGGSIVLSKIQPRNAEAFIADRLASGCCPSTVNKDIGTLRRIFNLAIEPRGYLPEGKNPFAKIKKRKTTENEIRYVEIEEYRSLANEADLWWKTLISIAYGGGLRRNEILHLTWTNVDFENQQIHVSPKKETAQTIEWEPKDHEKRVVPMANETAQLLANLQAQAKEGFSYIFISPKRLEKIRERQKVGNWTSRSDVINNLGRDFGVIRRQAGIAECSLHDLRRSAITNWAGQLPIQVVQQLAGHSDISTTRKYYLVVRSEDMASANKVLNEIFAKSKAD